MVDPCKKMLGLPTSDEYRNDAYDLLTKALLDMQKNYDSTASGNIVSSNSVISYSVPLPKISKKR